MLQGGPELLPNVHLLTLQALPRGQLLLRLAHLYQVNGARNIISPPSHSWQLSHIQAPCCLLYTRRKTRLISSLFLDSVLHDSSFNMIMPWLQIGEDEVLSRDATVDLARLLPAVTDGRTFHRGGAPLPGWAHALRGGPRLVLRDHAQRVPCLNGGGE